MQLLEDIPSCLYQVVTKHNRAKPAPNTLPQAGEYRFRIPSLDLK